MRQSYADFQFRLQVCSPVAAESPFESDTLWGRILCALSEGTEAQQALAKSCLDDLKKQTTDPEPAWQSPLIVSEGFHCDGKGEPWLPFPLALSLRLQSAKGHSRKDLKKVEWIPLSKFADLCGGEPGDPAELIELQKVRPRPEPALQPHLAMNRATGASLEGLLYMIALDVYRVSEPAKPSGEVPQPGAAVEANQRADAAKKDKEQGLVWPEMAFLLKLRQDVDAALIEAALKRVCDEGWGRAKSRGLGYIRFKSLKEWSDKPRAAATGNGFVSLSYFCPKSDDPTDGYWKLAAKHPVPAQFVDGERVILGSGEDWRPRSLLRLIPGSCFWFRNGGGFEEHYGRMLAVDELLQPPKEDDPPLSHYALAYPWPMLIRPELQNRG